MKFEVTKGFSLETMKVGDHYGIQWGCLDDPESNALRTRWNRFYRAHPYCVLFGSKKFCQTLAHANIVCKAFIQHEKRRAEKKLGTKA